MCHKAESSKTLPLSSVFIIHFNVCHLAVLAYERQIESSCGGGGGGGGRRRALSTLICFEVTVKPPVLRVQLAAELVVSPEDEERGRRRSERGEQNAAAAVGQRLEPAAHERSRTGGRVPGNG